MHQLRTTPNDLIACWQRYDWRQSMFAPGVVILQALTQEGFTASGLGSSRETAFARCLGETAELHALAVRPGEAGALLLEEAPVWFAALMELREITPPEGPIAVWHCRPALPLPDFAGDTGSPFV